MSKIKLATEWMPLQEQPPNCITAGDIMQILKGTDSDLPLAFVKYSDGETNFVEGVEIRKVDQLGKILPRDQEDSCKDTMPILILSVLG